MQATGGDMLTTTMLVLWLSAFASAFIDNIPFVATMIPLIKDMGNMGITNLDPLWWALSLGACLGGNGTLIGGYTRYGLPMMLLSIAISAVYIYFRFL